MTFIKSFGTITAAVVVVGAAEPRAAQWVARPDWIRATVPSGTISVPYAGNDQRLPAEVRRVVVVRGPRQGATKTPLLGDIDESTDLTYRQTNNSSTACRLDRMIFRVQDVANEWSNDTIVRVLVEYPPNGCGACTFDEDYSDCDLDGDPNECDGPPRRVMSAFSGGAQSPVIDAFGPRTRPAFSVHGRYVALSLMDGVSSLDPRDDDFDPDVYRFDLLTGELVLVSVSGDGASTANQPCFAPTISGDGSVVAFESTATNLAADANGSTSDVFVRDLSAPLTVVLSLRDDDTPPATGGSNRPSITEDARYVAFDSTSVLTSDAVPPGIRQVYQRDRINGTTRLISGVCDGQGQCSVAGNGHSYAPAVNARGRYTAFVTEATNLVSGDTLAFADVLVHDRNSGANLRVSVPNGGGQADGHSFAPAIDGSGGRVAFSSVASNLVSPSPGSEQVYVADVTGVWPVATSSISLQSADALGGPANQPARWPALSFDGARLAFQSQATDLAPGPSCQENVFLREIASGITRRMSVSERGSSVRSGKHSSLPSVGGDGTFVAFHCEAELDPRGSGFYVHASNKALQLDGTGWIRVLDDAILDRDAMTIDFWVRPDDVQSLQSLVSKWGDVGIDDRSYHVQIAPGGGIEWSLSRTDNQTSANYHGFTTGQVTAGTWHHVACTYEYDPLTQEGHRRTYVDGIQVGQKRSDGPVHHGSTDVAIGAHLPNNAAAGELHFRGRIDEVRIWSQALSQLDIRWNMNRQITAVDHDLYPDLVAVWGFELGAEDGLGHLTTAIEGEVEFVEAEDVPFLDFDCNANGYLDDIEIYTGLSADANGNGTIDSCELAPTFCDASDGALASCPCSNAGEPAGGCDNAQGTGGVRAEAIAFDALAHTATIRAWGFPSQGAPTSIVIRSSGLEPAPVAFGDGLRCVSTAALVRMAATTAIQGQALHQLSHGAGPGTFRYQAWYRNNPASYCTPAAFNLSSGWTLTW